MILTPTLNILLEDTDVAPLRVQGSGISVQKSLGYPQLLASTGNHFSFVLDNSDGDFDFNTPDNFFVRRGLPANGRGAKVLIKVSQHTEPPTVIFAGFVVDVRSNLNDTSIIIEVNDIVSAVFQSEPATLGQTIRRTITDYDGAADDYAEDNYAFRFPEHGIPIQRGSVRVIAPTGVQIVDAINITGALSNRRAEIDYVNSVIRFEDAPANGMDEEITIEWRIDYRFVRPDVLVRLLLEAGGLHQKLQLSDASLAAFAIERAQLETPLPSFSSHGSPYFDRIGVTRWMEWDQNEQKLYFVSDNRLIEYDDATSEQTFITTLPDTGIDGYETTVGYHFYTQDFDTFYVLTANTAKGDVRQDTAITRNKVEKYVRSSNTWTTLLHRTNGEPQLAHPFDFQNSIAYYADNSKTGLHVAFRNNNTFVFYRRVQANSASIAYSNENGGNVTNVHTESWSGDHQGLPYSMDFVIDQRSDGIYCYSFVVRYTSSSATLKIFRRRVSPNASETEIFSETFARTGGTDEYPISVSGIALADDRSKFYFVLSYVSEALNDYGKAELCCINKDGAGGRMVIKSYPNPLLAARSACEVNARYYYFEGGWVRRPKTSTDDDVPDEEHYYPNEGGNLIEILSDGSIADHGTAPRRFDIFDSPDASDLIYEGWGLFNACTSNIACNHQEDTLHLVAGFGLPIRVDDNLPSQAVADYIADVNNFARLQYGEKLSTKLDSFRTEDRRVWDMIVELANVVDYEVGFGPSPEAVADGRSTFPALTEFQANATVYFRPRTIQPAVLRSDITANTPSNILLDEATLQEFPSESNIVVVGNELIRYTASAEDGDGVRLSGITRGLFSSAAVAHDADEKVYFVDYFVSSEHENVLVTVTDRQLDYGNIKNIVKMEYGANIYEQRDRASVIQNGGRTLDLPRVLSATDLTWAEEMVNRYIREKDAQTLITYVDKINPKLSLSQSVVMHLHRRAKTDYQLFKVVRVTHDMSSWQTQAVIRSVGELRTAQPVAASIIAISGGGQSAPIGQTLNNSLIVQVNDQNGNPLGGVSVFAQTSDGSLNTESAITDGAGRASFSLTLPNTLGAVTVTMNVPGVSAAARFIATATQAALFASAITLVSGNNQVGKPNTALSQPLVVQVNDQNGNPLLGAQVTFSVTAGNGLPSPLTVLTDGNGRAQTTYTFGSGTMATETIRAEVAGLTASVTFSAVLQAASSVSVRSGNNQEILVSTSLSAFSVVVRDQANAGVSGIDVNWAIITGTGTLSVTTSTTNSSGVASAVFTATAAGAISVRASVNNVAQNAVFSANVYTYGQELTSERVDFDANLDGVIHNNFPPITLFAGRSSGRLRVFNTSGEILRTSDGAIPNGPLLHSSSSSVLILNNSTERIETWDTGSMTELTNSRVTLEVPSGQAILTIFGAGWDFNKTNILLSHLGDDPDTIFLEQKLSEVNTFTGSLQSTRPFDAFNFIEEAPNGILYTDSGEPTSSNRIRAYRKSDLVRISSLDINPSFGVGSLNYFNKRLYLFAGSSVRVLFIG